MEYEVKETSPVKRTVEVTVPAEEVNAAIGAAVALYRTDADIKGFRKGKAPSSMIESRFKKQIYSEATTELVNLHINQIIGEIDDSPVSRIDFDGQEMERDKDYSYAITFEVMPVFELPDFEGAPVEEEVPEADTSEIDAIFERVRNNMAEFKVIEDGRPAQDGELAVVTFQAFDEKGAPVPGIKAENFELEVGRGQALPEFEELIKSIEPGAQGQKDITFPEDFLNTEMAGKTVTFKAEVHSVKEKVLPELNDDFARKAGGFESMEKMREGIEHSYLQSRRQLYRSQAHKKLLDFLMEKVDFTAPESMVEEHVARLVGDVERRLDRQGKSIESTGKTKEQLAEEVRSEAEHMAKSQVFLLTAARKLELSVEEQEMDQYFQRVAAQTGENWAQIKRYYQENNLIFAVRDQILADKAMDAIYAKADVTETPVKDTAVTEQTSDAEAGGAE